MVTSQKEAFTGTVRVCGCQSWHPLRRPELGRNGAWGSWANGRGAQPPRPIRVLLSCGRKSSRIHPMASWGDGHPPHGMRSPQTSPNPQLSGGPQLGGIISLLESPILTRPGANILTLLLILIFWVRDQKGQGQIITISMFSITFLGAERKRSVSYSQGRLQLQITPSPLLQPSQAIESEGWLTQWSLDSAHRGLVKLPLKQEDHHHGAASILIRHL